MAYLLGWVCSIGYTETMNRIRLNKQMQYEKRGLDFKYHSRPETQELSDDQGLILILPSYFLPTTTTAITPLK